MTTARVIAFDVNETLLDLAPLDPVFERAFGNAAVRTRWFAQRLVAAHAWDVAGALAAGCAAAFVRRRGKVPSPLGDRPDIVGDDLGEVVARIIAIDRLNSVTARDR